MKDSLKANGAMVHFFIAPFFWIIFGALAATKWQSIHWFLFIILYMGLIMSQISAGFLMNQVEDEQSGTWRSFIVMQLLLGIIASYLGWKFSWRAALVFLIIHALKQLLILCIYYPITFIPTFLQVLLEPLVLNIFSFYTQMHFISFSVIPYFLPVTLLYIMLACKKWEVPLSSKMVLALIIGTALLTLGLLPKISIGRLFILAVGTFITLVIYKKAPPFINELAMWWWGSSLALILLFIF